MSLDPTILSSAAAPSTESSSAASAQPAGGQGQKLARLATEFESMLLTQMLREMRNSGSWKDEDEDKQGFGAETMFDSIDVELASQLAKSGGFGLEKSLVRQITGDAPTTASMLPANVPDALPSATLPATLPTTLAVPDPLPIADRVTTSPFGWRQDPFTGATTYHRGVDVRAAYGEPIGAAASGTVVFAGEQGGYGQTVVVEHEDGVRTRYAHLSSLMTEAGAEVKAGEPIGRAGRSGRATGTHLHFEVTQNGRPVDPRSHDLERVLKPERVTADWGVGVGPTLPGVPDTE